MGVNIVFATLCGFAGTIYAIWMIYAAGLNYLAMAFWFMAIGIVIYLRSRVENCRNNRNAFHGDCFFTTAELISAMLIIFIALAAAVWSTSEGTKIDKKVHKWAQALEQKIEKM